MNEAVLKLKTMRAGGFTLLEVLVALVVLSIGLIGLAGLQSSSLRLNNSAYLRSQATALAYDMTDRVRSNGLAFAVVDQTTGARRTLYDNPAADEEDDCESSQGCSPGATAVEKALTMAQHDMFRWNEQISEILPLGRGAICIDSTPEDVGCNGSGASYVIRVTWDDNRDGVADIDDPNENIVLSFLP